MTMSRESNSALPDQGRLINEIEKLEKAVIEYLVADEYGDVESFDELEPATQRLIRLAVEVDLESLLALLRSSVPRPEDEPLWVKGAKRLRSCFDEGHWGHALICNYSRTTGSFCNCGAAQLLAALKEHEAASRHSEEQSGARQELWKFAEAVERIIKRVKAGAEQSPKPESAGHLMRWLLTDLETLALALRKRPEQSGEETDRKAGRFHARGQGVPMTTTGSTASSNILIQPGGTIPSAASDAVIAAVHPSPEDGGPCATCAFRPGTEANRTEHTMTLARLCVEGGRMFYCHEHPGLCRGFVAAVNLRGVPDDDDAWRMSVAAAHAADILSACIEAAKAGDAVDPHVTK